MPIDPKWRQAGIAQAPDAHRRASDSDLPDKTFPDLQAPRIGSGTMPNLDSAFGLPTIDGPESEDNTIRQSGALGAKLLTVDRQTGNVTRSTR